MSVARYFNANLSRAICAVSILGATGAAHSYTGQELEKDAKVSIATARQIALKARPGKVSDEELEREPGGSGLRYSFDIKVRKATFEVGVDAATGDVLENKAEVLAPIQN